MHPLHDYVAKQLAERLKSKNVVVWYDARSEFVPFVGELRRGAEPSKGTVSVTVTGIAAELAEYDGSMFQLRAIVEPLVSGDASENVVIYVPGCERDRRGSVLMELEKAGECYEPQLKRLARNVLRQRYTDGVIDEMLVSDGVTYYDLARASSAESSSEPPSILKSVFHDTAGDDSMIAAWLMDGSRDAEMETKGATRELTKLMLSRFGLLLPETADLPKLRSIALRYVLAGEFRSDLTGTPPSSLDSVPSPRTKEEEAAVRRLAKRLRANFAEQYSATADRVEYELGLRAARIPPEELGSIDTFRFEEQLLLTHCGELVASEKFDVALKIVREREHSFWLDRDVARKAQWEACRLMADLGSVATAVQEAVRRVSGAPEAWIDAYTALPDGWYRMDQAQRRLETWIARLDDDAAERPLGLVRRAYDDTCNSMAQGFMKALVNAKWAVTPAMQQTHVYSDVVSERPKPVAYFLVDAMRFEMGVELSDRLPSTAEVAVRYAVVALPSITPVGMAALQSGASSSFSVVEQGGKLGALIDDSFLPDLTARKKFAAARIPSLVDVRLDELLGLQQARLKKKIESAQVIIVRSQEIDLAGETGLTFQARQVMDSVIDNVARAIRKLATAGVENAVVSADHGHLFHPYDRDESMRIDPPGGQQVDLHRRCWIGRGGTTPPGCVRVSASTLGYASDLDFVFPSGSGVFKAGGDLAFHHGGASLQELIVPVVTVRFKVRESGPITQGILSATGLPEVVTNRIFSVTVELGGDLFSGPRTVRPVLMAAGKLVGSVGMATDAELDRTTGCVTLEPGKQSTLAFLVSDESVASLRVVVLDPATDAELYRAPADIPVRFGV